jgi:predicted  nucleic acid-binding Zn-ribbon protein
VADLSTKYGQLRDFAESMRSSLQDSNQAMASKLDAVTRSVDADRQSLAKMQQELMARLDAQKSESDQWQRQGAACQEAIQQLTAELRAVKDGYERRWSDLHAEIGNMSARQSTAPQVPGEVERLSALISQLDRRMGELQRRQDDVGQRRGAEAEDESLRAQVQRLSEKLEGVRDVATENQKNVRERLTVLEELVQQRVRADRTTEQKLDAAIRQFEQRLADMSRPTSGAIMPPAPVYTQRQAPIDDFSQRHQGSMGGGMDPGLPQPIGSSDPSDRLQQVLARCPAEMQDWQLQILLQHCWRMQTLEYDVDKVTGHRVYHGSRGAPPGAKTDPSTGAPYYEHPTTGKPIYLTKAEVDQRLWPEWLKKAVQDLDAHPSSAGLAVNVPQSRQMVIAA